MRHSARLVMLVLGASLLGCSSEATLLVDLKTDWVPGAEFSEVRVELMDGDTTRFDDAHAVALDDDYGDGVRVAQITGLAHGSYRLRATLLDEAGQTRAVRPVEIDVDGDTIVTVLVDRSCQGVRCPGSGNAAATACLGGVCVDPRCTPETPELCPVLCTSDTECDAPVDACAEARCVHGACLQLPRENGCPSPQRCDPVRGCFDPAPPQDAGPPDAAVDGGPGEAGTQCAPEFAVGCMDSLNSLARGSMVTVNVVTTQTTDQWSSSCGGNGAADWANAFLVQDTEAYEFVYSGPGEAAISVHDNDCDGAEMGCGVGRVEVTAMAGQRIVAVVESTSSDVCVDGFLQVQRARR